MKIERFLSAAPDVLDFLREVIFEYRRSAIDHGATYNSCHEGYGVTLEELDELWDWVKLKAKKRDPEKMRAECVQIASCALKFALTLRRKSK
jgi:hypothetical protein